MCLGLLTVLKEVNKRDGGDDVSIFCGIRVFYSVADSCIQDDEGDNDFDFGGGSNDDDDDDDDDDDHDSGDGDEYEYEHEHEQGDDKGNDGISIDI